MCACGKQQETVLTAIKRGNSGRDLRATQAEQTMGMQRGRSGRPPPPSPPLSQTRKRIKKKKGVGVTVHKQGAVGTGGAEIAWRFQKIHNRRVSAACALAVWPAGECSIADTDEQVVVEVRVVLGAARGAVGLGGPRLARRARSCHHVCTNSSQWKDDEPMHAHLHTPTTMCKGNTASAHAPSARAEEEAQEKTDAAMRTITTRLGRVRRAAPALPAR